MQTGMTGMRPHSATRAVQPAGMQVIAALLGAALRLSTRPVTRRSGLVAITRRPDGDVFGAPVAAGGVLATNQHAGGARRDRGPVRQEMVDDVLGLILALRRLPGGAAV